MLFDCFIVMMGLCYWCGKIFVDYLCNGCGVSMIVVYLVCVWFGMGVLVLFDWDEVFEMIGGV